MKKTMLMLLIGFLSHNAAAYTCLGQTVGPVGNFYCEEVPKAPVPVQFFLHVFRIVPHLLVDEPYLLIKKMQYNSTHETVNDVLSPEEFAFFNTKESIIEFDKVCHSMNQNQKTSENFDAAFAIVLTKIKSSLAEQEEDPEDYDLSKKAVACLTRVCFVLRRNHQI